jgi:hypothetical protein
LTSAPAPATNFADNGSHWRTPLTSISTTTSSIAGIKVPDSKLARAVTELVRDTETPLLFHHSSRVYYFGALAGKRRGLKFDPELLYTGAMFHDMGLMPSHTAAPMNASRLTAQMPPATSREAMAGRSATASLSIGA